MEEVRVKKPKPKTRRGRQNEPPPPPPHATASISAAEFESAIEQLPAIDGLAPLENRGNRENRENDVEPEALPPESAAYEDGNTLNDGENTSDPSSKEQSSSPAPANREPASAVKSREASPSVPSPAAVAKERESRTSLSSTVRELPLDALIPRAGSREELDVPPAPATMPPAIVPPRPIYPALNGVASATEKPPVPATRPPMIVPQISVEAVRESPPPPRMQPQYPKLAAAGEATAPSRTRLIEVSGESELLSEGQLLEYYQNEQLDFVDDFVDVFIEQELEPRNLLFELLERYKHACDELEQSQDAKMRTAQELTKVNNEVWSVHDRKITQQGTCGDDRSAAGEAFYKAAQLVPEKLVELQEKLVSLTSHELDQSICLEIRARALALLIQWTIVDINNRFLGDHQVSANSMPALLNTSHSLPSRRILRGVLSDLFYFLRFPVVPKRFRASISAWITEVGSVMLKACSTDDQMFLLCQILRVPSPLGDWAAPLIQTFISIPCMDIARPMDSFVALLSLLLEPVRYREEFLNRVVKYYEGDNSWNLITEDGEADNSTLAQISETDLVTILSQFCIRSLFSLAVKHFTYIHQGNRRQVLLSLVSFALIVLKLLDQGLKTYNGFKNFSKKLSDYIRKAVQYICAYWNLSKDQLLPVDRLMLQNEINRIVLQAMYYIVSKKSVGLWQFLVDFPYGTVTETCRMRCQILLRNSATTTVQKLYDILDTAVADHLKAGGSLADRMSDVGKEDTTYMLSALAAVISHSESEINHFVYEIIDVCFLDENTREQYYKVGSEAMSVVIERCPQMLSHVLRYIDRRIDHLDQYAVDILTNAPLSNCTLSKEDVGSLLGKWLINRPVNHPASHIARRVLTSMNWGTPSKLWIPQEVHDACADTIVKAHIVQCKSRNSLIAKSVSKAAKMATKCPDLEQQFDKFCWDVLLRLKITEKPATKPTNDLTAFFVYLVQKCMATPEAFLEHGMHYFAELVNSTCFNAAVCTVSRVVAAFPARMHLFTANTSFRDCVERLIHADESHYAVQILMGADKFPGPVLRLLASAIAYQISMAPDKTRKKDLSMAWMYVLTCKKTVDWNMDKFVLYLIGSITKTAVANDPEELFGLVDVITNLYKALFQAWKDTPRGPLSWFSSQAPPPLIACNLLTISPWASFLLLRAEPRIYSAFYAAMNNTLGKYPSRTLDEAVKKASSKAHVVFTVDRLDYYRWLELCVVEGVSDHHSFPLILQQICIAMFSRKDYEGKKHFPGGRFFASPVSETLFAKLRNDVLPRAEKAADNERVSVFYHAVAQWLFTDGVYRTDFIAYGDLILDYLLQMIVSGDTHLWTEFLETNKLRSSIKNDCKIYSMTCHLEDMPTAARLLDPTRQFESMTKLFAFLDAASDTQPFPLVPIHQSLPSREQMDAADACNTPVVYSKFSALLEELNKAARSFIDGKEKVERLNSAYLELFQKLYTDHQSSIQLTLRCGNFISSKCARPTQVNTVVTSSHYDQAIATQMNDNRQKREEEVGRLLTTLDSTAITSAHLEYICGLLHGFASGQGKIRGDQLRATGLRLFYGICNSVGSFNLLFLAAAAVYEACLRKLGKAFLQENASEQVNLMRVVLSGNPLNHFLVEHFTPHCVSPAQLFELYAELSASVRNATTSEAALSLLSRLDIAHAGEQMPPNQFSSLMPVIFENLASVTGNESPLKQLCMDHFIHAMFHQFPYNFTHGLRLILSGCDSNVVPPSLFAEVASQLSVDVLLSDHWTSQRASRLLESKRFLLPKQARESVRAIADQLSKSRRELATRLYSVWLHYLEHVCRLVDYFIRVIVNSTFRSESPPSVIEKELRDLFCEMVTAWAPLLEPVNTGLAPWNPADAEHARLVVERFIQLLMWLPHCMYLPPGSETVESLMWQYFSSKLITLQRAGTAHVFEVYEVKMVALNWSRFWPTLLDLGAMEHMLVEGPPEAIPLLTEILVRIQWLQVIQHQHGQPEDAHKAFHSLILSIIARCVHRQANYAKSRVSVEKLVKSLLAQCQWFYVKAETIEKTGAFVASAFPSDALTSPNDILKAFFNIWRQTCFFSSTPPAVPPTVTSDLEIPRKQSLYVRTDLRLLLKSGMERTEQAKHYKELIAKCNLILGSADKTQYLCLAKELIAFWTEITKEKHAEVFTQTLCDWLNEHAESPMLLLVLNTAMDALGASAPQVGLRLLDKSIQSYFTRRLSCEWAEVCQWFNLPERAKEWLYTTPSSDSGVEPRYLVLNAQLMLEMARLQSVQDETRLMKRLADYIQSVKPKYVTSEPAFLLCVEKWQRMLLRQCSNGISPTVANENLEVYLAWLRKVHSEEKSGVSFFSMVTKFGRKPTYPVKIQLLTNLLSLYITQQQTSAAQQPRMHPGQAVFQSRIQAFRDLQQAKQYQEVGASVFPVAGPFFTQHESHCFPQTTQLFSRCVQLLYPDEKILQKLDL